MYNQVNTHNWLARLSIFALAIVLNAHTSALAREWGNLTGRFVYDGPAPAAAILEVSKDKSVCAEDPKLLDESLLVNNSNHGLANVLIWVRSTNVEEHPDYFKTDANKVTIETKHCRFAPHIITCMKGQPLEVKNSDPVLRNVTCMPVINAPFTILVQPNSAKNIPGDFLHSAEVMSAKMTSNTHPWMSGFLLALANPYVAVTDTDGGFVLKNLPAGNELEFQVWQEKSGPVQQANINGSDVTWRKGRFKMTVKPGDNQLGEIKLNSALFN